MDTQRRQAITEAETIKARRNRASEEIAKLKKSGQDATAQMSETKELREQIQQLEKAAAELETRLQEILAGIPNLPHESVPAGKTPEDNVEVRRWGTPPKFDFTPKPHWELGRSNSAFSISNARRNSPARVLLCTGIWARRLERALANFMLDLHTAGARLYRGAAAVSGEFGVNVRHRANCPNSRPILFRVPHGEKDLWLIPTAEVPVTNLYRDEVLGRFAPAGFAHGLHAVFSQRSRFVRQRRARHHPAAPVPES